VKILLSNDDGYNSTGISKLADTLSKKHEVLVFAPKFNKSASSSSLTIDKPLKPIKLNEKYYYLEGTPSDCVHMALCGFFDDSFDIVIAGINSGPNLGDDVIYSGTVAAAIEGRFLGLPSMAVSLASWDGVHFETAARITEKLINIIHFSELSPSTILNVNVPDVSLNQVKGFQTTILGSRHQSEDIYPDKDDCSQFWIGENGKEANNGIGTDFYAVKNNYVSVTPLHIDLTNQKEITLVEEWLKKIN